MYYLLFEKGEKKHFYEKSLIVNQNNGDSFVILKNLEYRTLSKFENFLKINVIKRICLCNALKNNESILQIIHRNNITILNKKWLFDFICVDLLEYLMKNQNDIMERTEISVLINSLNDVWIKNLEYLAGKCKLLNIVTENERQFDLLSKKVNSNGVMINFNNNYKKTLINSKYIINVDFECSEFKKYNLNNKAFVIFKRYEKFGISHKFDGVFVTDYEIENPNDYKNEFLGLDNAEFYESIIYQRTIPENIFKRIKKDNVYVKNLYGINGDVVKNT